MELTKTFIEMYAGNVPTVSYAKRLAENVYNLRVSKDGSLLLGECKGSAQNPYGCSVDFICPNAPVSRCTCPSRRFPCKHCVALLYARLNGAEFTETDIPDDIAAKRAKAAEVKKNAAKKAININAPVSKASMNAAIKKIDNQLDGLLTAEKILDGVVKIGLAGIDVKMRYSLNEQVLRLGNYHINGVQTAFNELLLRLPSLEQNSGNYTSSVEQTLYISALLKKAKAHLTSKKNSGGDILKLAVDSPIEEQIGFVWKLDQLRAYGCFEENAELLQLGFVSRDDPARQDFVDTGFFLNLKNGVIYRKINYRPYRAVKHIKEDDSVADILQVPEMFYYPGYINPRCRFSEFALRKIAPIDLKMTLSHAKNSFPEAVKTVKNQIKDPLADKNPLVLLKAADFDGGRLIDAAGYKQILIDAPDLRSGETPPLDIMRSVNSEIFRGAAVLVMYNNDINTGVLSAAPICAVTDGGIVRLI